MLTAKLQALIFISDSTDKKMELTELQTKHEEIRAKVAQLARFL